MTEAKGSQQIERVQQRFEAWRKSCKPRSRIPERLWSAAAELATSHGVHKVARILRLDYYNLKERCNGTAGSAASGQSSASFIELMPGQASRSAECVIELENAKGAKMRIHFKGEVLPDASSLCAEFLKNGR